MDLGGTPCDAILPSNAPIPLEDGALNDHLLPMRDSANGEELELDSSDSDSSEGSLDNSLILILFLWLLVHICNHGCR